MLCSGSFLAFEALNDTSMRFVINGFFKQIHDMILASSRCDNDSQTLYNGHTRSQSYSDPYHFLVPKFVLPPYFWSKNFFQLPSDPLRSICASV